MKKRTLALFCIGIIAMIVGAIGSNHYFKKSEQIITQTDTKDYSLVDKINTTTLNLNISGDTDIYICSSTTDTVQLSTQSTLTDPIVSSWDIAEKNNQLNITLADTKQNSIVKDIGFDFFTFYRESAITLFVPSTITHLVVTGNTKGNTRLTDTTLEKLDITLSDSDLTLDSIKSDELSVNSKSGDISLINDVKSTEATLVTTDGDISLSDVSTSTYTLSSTNGDITASNISGVGTIETTSGKIDGSFFTGSVSVSTIEGDISLSLNNKITGLNVQSTKGDIELDTTEIIYNVSIQTKSEDGSIQLFDTDDTTYTQGNKSKKFKLQTTLGDISVDGPFD